MCNPTAIMMGLNLAQGGLQYSQQQDLAEAQDSHQRKMTERNAALANRSAVRQYEDTLRRQQEEQARTAASISDVMSQAQLALGTARVEAAEGGVAGASVNALVQDYARQQNQQIGRLERSQGFIDEQTSQQLDAIRDNQEAQLLGLVASPIPYPSLLGTALNIGAQSYSDFETAQRRGGS